ncbi:unnamed protein product, partial [Discosporangium mesarthrocarpum]
LRAILKRLDSLSIEALMEVTIPRAVPLVYDLDEGLEPIPSPYSLGPLSGFYLG